tara:strand:+ start:2186 stop:2644 length:459 start_codon:yes stop_codon:yes gene_type:complete
MKAYIAYIVQVITVIILLSIMFIDQKDLFFLRNNTVQLLIACIVVLVLLAVDPLSGLILATAMFVAYYKLYKSRLFRSTKHDEKYIWGDKDYADYITPDRLEVAQDNTWDKKNYNEGFVGINHKDNDVYGTQGLYDDMPGFAGDKVSMLADI